MNILAVCCLMLGTLFLVFGVVFALLKEKGAMLISGFNTIPKAEREKYDKKKMSLDMRNLMLLYALVMFAGAVLAQYVHNGLGWASLILLAVLFFKEVHLDTGKAFGKYRL